MEIVKLIGADVLAEEQKLDHSRPRALSAAGFLQQNAMHEDGHATFRYASSI